jgi:hypothetical protein
MGYGDTAETQICPEKIAFSGERPRRVKPQDCNSFAVQTVNQAEQGLQGNS